MDIEAAYRELFEIEWIPEPLGQTDPLTIYHALPSFIALAIGLSLATLVFFLELCKQWKKNDKNQAVDINIEPNTSTSMKNLRTMVS